jgi:hypothetical protein
MRSPPKLQLVPSGVHREAPRVDVAVARIELMPLGVELMASRLDVESLPRDFESPRGELEPPAIHQKGRRCSIFRAEHLEQRAINPSHRPLLRHRKQHCLRLSSQ